MQAWLARFGVGSPPEPDLGTLAVVREYWGASPADRPHPRAACDRVAAMPLTRPASSDPLSPPPAFQVLAKPSGATCNIDCSYCFFLSKSALYPNDAQRMSQATLEAYLGQLLAAHHAPEITVAWQGGEPTLMKLDFFQRAIDCIARLRRPGQRIVHSLQTNGLLLDDAWCRFLHQHRFLVGLSMDGPPDLHDAYRVDRRGQGTFHLVRQAWERLQRHGVEVNILCTVNAANQAQGLRVYRFFRDELGARHLQFIPIVERSCEQPIQIADRAGRSAPAAPRPLYTQSGDFVTTRSVGPRAYGQFLVDVFEEWLRRDVGDVHVQLFEVTLGAEFGQHALCVHAPTCGTGAALEHNGDLYSCDHFVEPAYLLGNIHHAALGELMGSAQQQRFGAAKRDRLTAQCRACALRPQCHGGCPKDRFARSREGEAGHNYLCPGYELFFAHSQPAMRAMAEMLRRQEPAARVRELIQAEDQRRGPQAPCTCGSGRALGACHGVGPAAG